MRILCGKLLKRIGNGEWGTGRGLMLECWNGGLEGLGGLESLEFRVGSLEFRVLSSLPLTTKH